MPRPTATAYAARLLFLAALGTFGSASEHCSPPTPFLGSLCWILFFLGLSSPFPSSVDGWQWRGCEGEAALSRHVSIPSLCIISTPIQSISRCWRALCEVAGGPMGAGPHACAPCSICGPIPECRRLHVCAGGNDSAVTHRRAGGVPRGEPRCQEQPRGRVRGQSCVSVRSRELGRDREVMLGCAGQERDLCSCHPCWVTRDTQRFTGW